MTARYADRVALMSPDGRMAEMGDPRQLMEDEGSRLWALINKVKMRFAFVLVKNYGVLVANDLLKRLCCSPPTHAAHFPRAVSARPQQPFALVKLPVIQTLFLVKTY